MTHLILFLPLLAQPQPAPAPPAPPAATPPPIAFPHPLITEVLYAVPNAPEADANKDGARHVAGDEFVELVNPHDRPIQLLGYTLTDRNPEKKGQLKFTFPAFELPPGAVVAVFNGCESTWSGVGPVGDAQKAPPGPNESFDNAFVFTARITSSRTSFANGGDFVLLSDPNAAPIHLVSWGTFKEKLPAATLAEVAPLTSKASVQRDTLHAGFGVHVTPDTEPRTPFSPGRFPLPPKPKEPAAPEPAKPATGTKDSPDKK